MPTARRCFSVSHSNWPADATFGSSANRRCRIRWVYLEGDLINDETGVVQSFPIDISYYQGVEDGESWTEGAQKDSTDTSSMPGGKYVLRLEGQWERWQQPATVSVKIEQNVTNGFNFMLRSDRLVDCAGNHGYLSHQF